MKSKKLQSLIHDTEQLLAIEEMALISEKSWYFEELQKTLGMLEDFKSTLRMQYGLQLSEILKMSELPQDMTELARIIAMVKYRLRHYTGKQPCVSQQQAPKTNRYYFYQ